MDTFSNIFVGIWLVFGVYWLVSAASSKKSIRNRQWSRGVLVRIVLFFGVLTLVSLSSSRQSVSFNSTEFSGPARLFGLLVMALGVGIAIWARRHLGKNWGMPMSLKADPELVTSGPYAYIRNPIYSGMLLMLLGSTIVEGFGWFVLFVVFGLYFIYSAKVEEKIMLAAFPNTYPAYKARTKMLIPFVL